MRITIYLLALAPLVFAGCETEPPTVTTLRPSFGLKRKPWRRGRGMSGHVAIGDGPEPITCGSPAVGWCDQGRPLCG